MKRAVDVLFVVALGFVAGWSAMEGRPLSVVLSLLLMAPWLAYQHPSIAAVVDYVLAAFVDRMTKGEQT